MIHVLKKKESKFAKNNNDKVRFPMFSRDVFGDKVKTIGKIDLKEGGVYVSDDVMITSNILPNTINLVVLFVKFTSKSILNLMMLFMTTPQQILLILHMVQDLTQYTV